MQASDSWSVIVPVVPLQEQPAYLFLQSSFIFALFLAVGCQTAWLIALSVWLGLRFRWHFRWLNNLSENATFLTVKANGSCYLNVVNSANVANQPYALNILKLIRSWFYITLVFQDRTIVITKNQVSERQWRRLHVVAQSAVWQQSLSKC